MATRSAQPTTVLGTIKSLRYDVVKAGGGKSKGSSFERDVCRRLSLWVSEDKHEDVFWRSSMSGGRATVAHKRGIRLTAQAGDICAIHPLGQPFLDNYLCECKHYRDLQLRGLLTGGGKLIEFWREACTQADRYGRKPMLIAKQNNLPVLVCVRSVDKHWTPAKVSLLLIVPHCKMVIFWFENMLKSPPQME